MKTDPGVHRQFDLNRMLTRGGILMALTIAALLFAAPLIIMLLTSFKAPTELKTGSLLSGPEQMTLESWIKAWTGACISSSCDGLQSYLWNSLKITLPAVLLSTAWGAVTGYLLSFWRFRGSEFFFGMILVGCFVPHQLIILPMAALLGRLGLSQGIGGVILAHVIYGLSFTTLFMRNYYASLPQELIRAARMDGAGIFVIFWRIILPLSRPILMVTVIWQFTGIWNDFLFGSVFTSGAEQPVTVALNNLVNTTTGTKEYPVEMAAALLTCAPTLLVYFLAGKHFVKGLAAGAVK
jgi:glucose/mannose transport system permease protein